MKFSLKAFLSIFASVFFVGTALIFVGYRYTTNRIQAEYASRYSALSDVIANTIWRSDVNTEVMMKNAATYVAEIKGRRPYTQDSLKFLRDKLSVTHLFIINADGKFALSTTDDVDQIPNLYSFCDRYRDLLRNGHKAFEATPILHPTPNPKPFKFLFLPTPDKKQIVEVGMHVDFIAKTLLDTLASDPNLISISMYYPSGEVFGRFNSSGVGYEDKVVQLPLQLPAVQEGKGTMNILTKVTSSHPKCCQCDTAGTSRGGEYYYVLDVEVSKKTLTAMLATLTQGFSILAFLHLILSLVLSSVISRQLSKKLDEAVARIRSLQLHKAIAGRIGLKGKDEVAFLTQEFDSLLDTLETSQRLLVDAERNKVRIQIAREVAHNIKSPLLALEMLLPALSSVPDRLIRILRDSLAEIKQLSDKLLVHREPSLKEMNASSINLCSLLERVIEKERISFLNAATILYEPPDEQIFVNIDPTDLTAALSNIISNAVESYMDAPGVVTVILKKDPNSERCSITIRDAGCGIPPKILLKLGRMEVSHNKERGLGIGLLHAFRVIQEKSGEITIDSTVGKGTTVVISLPASAST